MQKCSQGSDTRCEFPAAQSKQGNCLLTPLHVTERTLGIPAKEITVNIARAAQHARLRLIIPALAVAIAGLIIPFSQIASAHTTSRAVPSGGPKPTIVLEHGAWANTASWYAVIQRLQADGYTVYAPPNPLQGLTYDSAFLADFLHSISGPIVLVGHSYGGEVITNAATGDSQVLAATQQPLATIALTQPSGVPAWKTIPSWAVVGTADHAIPLALQLAMAENAHAHITEVDAPHLSMISDPGVVTSVILQAVHATT
jgi:pimeloyl-ACP methyl ester carboxylesterase